MTSKSFKNCYPTSNYMSSNIATNLGHKLISFTHFLNQVHDYDLMTCGVIGQDIGPSVPLTARFGSIAEMSSQQIWYQVLQMAP